MFTASRIATAAVSCRSDDVIWNALDHSSCTPLHRTSFTSNSRSLRRTRKYRIFAYDAAGIPDTTSRRFNQVIVSYDASKDERVEALTKKHAAVTERLKEKS